MDKLTAIGPGELEPAEIAHKLTNAMEDNLQLQAGGIRLAPNVYDIYLSIDDHRRLSAGQSILIDGWRRNLESLARQRHYLLRTSPIIRLHADSKLRRKIVNIVAVLQDAQHMGGGEDGAMATKEFSTQDMLRAQAQFAQSQAGMSQSTQPPNAFAYPGGGSPNSSNIGMGATVPPHLAPPMQALPTAWLTIRLPQGGQQIYRLEKTEINIGRQRSNDIIVEDKRVSRLHAKILFQNGQFTVFDLGSVNGVTVNNIAHVQQHILHSGDRFTIGSYEFQFDERR